MGFVLLGVLSVLAIIGLARPYIGLLALLIVMELDPGELYPYLAPLHLERIVALILLISFLIHGEKLRFPAPIRWFLAFYGAMILSIPLALWRGNAVAACFSFLEVVVYAIFVTALLTTERRIKWFIFTFVMLIDWMSASAIWNYAHGGGYVAMHIYRAVGITSAGGDPNTMSLTLLAAMPLAIALAGRTSPAWMRVIAVGSIGVSLVTIVETGSRGAAMGVIFLIVLLMARRPKNLLYLPLLIVISPLIWMAIPQQYKARYETVDHLKTDESYQNRILSWRGGVAMFESNPITGIGAGGYVSANGTKFWPGIGRKHYLDAHSLYFKILGELGLIGVITFAGFVICVFRWNFRIRRELERRNVSAFLLNLPGLFSIIFLQLLFAGYASHDVYRHTWYVVAAMASSVGLLPILLQQPASIEKSVDGVALDQSVLDGEWSPALLPVLRNKVPVENEPA